MILLATVTTTKASVFVTTYGVGNRFGFATGKWFDLTQYSDKDEFIEAATKYAQEELKDFDPELCFSDIECSFSSLELISESYIDSDVWEVLEMSDYDLEILTAYKDAMGCEIESVSDSLDEAKDCYAGYWESDEDYASDYLEESGYMVNLPPIIANNIDLEGVAKELLQGMGESNGHYFYNQ